MKKILLAGYFGAGNTGDEAILKAILQSFPGGEDGFEFIVLSWNPEQTAATYQVDAVYWRDIAAILEAARQVEGILVGGGGLFQDYWGFDPDSYLRRGHANISSYGGMVLLANIFGIPVVLFGVGVGPLHSETAQEHTLQVFARSQGGALRDEHSLHLLQTLDGGQDLKNVPLQVFTDAAFGSGPSSEVKPEVDSWLSRAEISPSEPLLGISLRYWDRPHPPSHWIPALAAGVERFLSEQPDFKVLFLPFQISEESVYTHDLAVCRQVQEALPPAHQGILLTEDLPPEAVRGLIGRCSLLIGMRYHAVVFAIDQKTPFAALPYDPKITHLVEENQLQALAFSSYAPDEEEVYSRLNAVWRERKAVASRLNRAGARNRKLAVEQVRFAEELLNQPIQPPSRAFLQEQIAALYQLVERLDRKRRQDQEAGGENIPTDSSSSASGIQARRPSRLVRYWRTIPAIWSRVGSKLRGIADDR